jgi:CheY-like chemotaxis protein
MIRLKAWQMQRADKNQGSRRQRILVADDIELNRILVSEILASANFEVDTVADGQAAVGALASADYDLVLMDIDMSGFDGHAASDFIRRMGGRAAIPPIVALTSKSQEGDREKSLASGMDDHIPRPIAPRALIERITQILALRAVASNDGSSETLCRSTYESLTDLLGQDRILMFLSLLAARLSCMKTMLEDPNRQRAAILRHAHDLASSAGMLGFMEVSRASQSIARRDMDEAASYASLRTAIGRAMMAVDGLSASRMVSA